MGNKYAVCFRLNSKTNHFCWKSYTKRLRIVTSRFALVINFWGKKKKNENIENSEKERLVMRGIRVGQNINLVEKTAKVSLCGYLLDILLRGRHWRIGSTHCRRQMDHTGNACVKVLHFRRYFTFSRYLTLTKKEFIFYYNMLQEILRKFRKNNNQL